MKFERNPDVEKYNEISEVVKQNDGYCPCFVFKNDSTKCICEDFKNNVKVGEFCHCGRFRKLEM